MNLAPIRPAASTRHQEQWPLGRALRIGLIFGAVAVYITVVGILPLIDARWIIVNIVSLGDAALIAIGLGVGAAIAGRRKSAELGPLVLPSLLAGGIAGGLLALLAWAMQILDLRQIFIALSPATLKTLTFGLGAPLGGAVLIVAAAVLAVLGAALTLAPIGVRQPVLVGLAVVVVFGVFQELIQIMMQFGDLIGTLREAIYTWEGLSLQGALVIFVLAGGGALLWTRVLSGRFRNRVARLSPAQRTYAGAARIVVFILLLVLFPVVAGSYIGQVMMLVGLYMLMGMGLNLEVGLAG
ncbi:MAG: hypothetical protein JO163_03440, partial [Methylobacteriaceae bacterium]|nr:hypothetical protein [Methylobacteriaceae bacterium]